MVNMQMLAQTLLGIEPETFILWDQPLLLIFCKTISQQNNWWTVSNLYIEEWIAVAVPDGKILFIELSPVLKLTDQTDGFLKGWKWGSFYEASTHNI